MKAVILVGGYGTRMRPLTITTPKPLLPLVNMPLLEFVIRHLKKYGVEDIILSTSYMPDVFHSSFGDGEGLGVKLTCVTEEEPLGTCGAVKNVEDHLDEEPFLVLNGDILTDLDIAALVGYHDEKGATVSITLTPVEDPTAYGLVPTDDQGRIERFLEKPSWDEIETNLINAGTYVLERKVLDEVPENQNYSFERGLFPLLLRKGEPLYGYVEDCYWLDVGTPAKYLTAHLDVLSGKLPFDYQERRSENGVMIGEGVEVAADANLFPPCVLGDGCLVEEGATVGPRTVLGAGCHVGPGATVEGSVLLEDVDMSEDCLVQQSLIGNKVSLGKGVHIAEGAVLGDNITVGPENELKRGIKVWPFTELGEGRIRF